LICFINLSGATYTNILPEIRNRYFLKLSCV
jgi:hypothetical protein